MFTNLLFELIQVALERKENLSQVPSASEWEAMFEEAEHQAIVGILQKGLERLSVEQRPYLDLLLEWIGTVQIIKSRNELLDERCLELLRWLENAGLRACVLKGQGIARLYGNLGELRQPGDIDVYVDCGREKAIERVERIGYSVEGWDYKHAHVCVWENTEVELHYRVEVMFNLFKNRKLQKWFKAHEDEIFGTSKDSENSNTDDTNLTDGMVTPTVGFNVFYILLHIYRHFFTEGVGLRQIMDYYFVLKKCHADSTSLTDKYCAAVSEFGMERFAKGLMWVMQEVMAMPREWMLWEPDEKEGRYILEQVMEGGNFGHYSKNQTRLTGGLGYVVRHTRHSLHLMRRYPAEAIWIPVWMVWHKLWKISHR